MNNMSQKDVMDMVTKPVEFVVSNDNVPRTLKAVNRYVQKHHILRTIKTKMYFEKPSEKRLRKSKECDRRRRKNARAHMDDNSFM